MKKILILLAVTLLLLSVCGQAMAYFEDGHLIRAVYQLGGQFEVLTDLGPFSQTTPYTGANIALSSNPFPPAGTGVFVGTNWTGLRVAYFIKTATAAWTSGPMDGQVSGSRKFPSFVNAVSTVCAGAVSYASGSAQATIKQSDLQSYVSWMDNGDPVNTGGYFAGFTPGLNGEQTLAALGTGSSFVASYLYYYASPNAAAPGLKVADIRTYANGHTEIAAVSNSPVATHFMVSAPASAAAGAAFNVTVTALDAGNKTVTGYTGTVHFTSTDTKAVLPADVKLTSGTGTFSVTLKTAGSRTITAKDTVTATIAGASAAINVTAGAATHFTVTAPASATAGAAFNFTVTALDKFNNKAKGYAGTAHFMSTDPAAVLPLNSKLTSGAGTFPATLKTSGNRTITATDTVTATITGVTKTIKINAAAATHFTVAAPASATAGTAFNFTVTALDQFNNTATGYAGTAHFTSTDAKAVLPANATLVSGAGTFPATLKTSGNRTITATDTVTAAITGVTKTIKINAAAATHFTVAAPASATAGTAFNFTVTALDQFNNKAIAYAGTAHFTSTDAAATLPANSKLTSGTGIFSATLKTAGSRTITAADTVTATIKGVSKAITVN